MTNKPASENEIKYHDKIRNNYIKKINKDIDESIRNKAMLSLKYENLNLKINIVQISVIIISALLTLIGSLKAYYDIDSKGLDTITIILTASITLIMSIYRFFKLDDKKEKICNLLESYTLIINKFKKFLVKVSDFIIKVVNVKEWEEMILNYKTELLDYYVSIKENFDNIFTYKEVLKYKNIYIKLSLEQSFLNNELDTIQYCHNDEEYLKYYNINDSSCFSKKRNLDKNKFMKEKQNELASKRDEYESYQKKTNQEHYNEFCLASDIREHSPKENINSENEIIPEKTFQFDTTSNLLDSGENTNSAIETDLDIMTRNEQNSPGEVNMIIKPVSKTNISNINVV